MKISTRLTLLSSLTFGIVFIIAAVLIYGLYYKSVEKSAYTNMQKTCMVAGIFYLEEDELSNTEFDKIRKQYNSIIGGYDVRVYNEQNEIQFGVSESDTLVTASILQRVRENKSVSFRKGNSFYSGIYYPDNQGNFVVLLKDRNNDIQHQMQLLLMVLLIVFVVGLVAIMLLSRLLARSAYRPFTKVIQQVQSMAPTALDTLIASPDTNDELQVLTDTFNDLLKKIYEAFVVQKNFVSYVSHEFKTPLASIIGNLEVFASRNRTAEEYQVLANKLIGQVSRLEEILNTLIVLSGLRKDTDFSPNIRIDELVWDIIDRVTEQYPQAKLSVQVDVLPENELALTINANGTQLFMAIYNLIENAVKYSGGKQVEIRLYNDSKTLFLSIQDNGIGIPPEELPYVSQPFYRADNARTQSGSGIGLSIALQILERNNITYQITSQTQQGTRLLLQFLVEHSAKSAR